MPREIVFTGKQKFELLDYQDPLLAANEVRGRTLCTLISPGTELAWANEATYPLRPGYAAVFEAEEIGSGVDTIKKGDRLLCMGGHRSTQQFEARFTTKVPDGVTNEQAAIARLMGVSTTTLMTTKARPGDIVIVCGAGPVGYLAAQQCRIAGYETLLIEPDARRRAQAETSGVATAAAMPLGDPAYQDRVAMVIDCSGHEQAVLDGCKIVRKGGEVVLVGVPWKAYTQLRAHDILHAVFFRFVNLRSGWEWEIPVVSRDFVWEELYEGYNNAPHNTFSGLAKALKWLEQGLVRTEGLARSFSPANPPAVYGALMRKEVDEPFVILDWKALD